MPLLKANPTERSTVAGWLEFPNHPALRASREKFSENGGVMGDRESTTASNAGSKDNAFVPSQSLSGRSYCM